ncbi:MAG: glycosyltransferase family 39 protein [Chloroflexi bacterium]|nr:glycosyltransferase family 39 protein [Chloroflexota bacterium]
MQRRDWRQYIPLLIVLAAGAALLVFLADRTLQADPYDWLQSAKTLYRTGDTGFQHRNILYAYFLVIPLFLHLDVRTFGLILSGISLLLSAALIYRINLEYTSPRSAGFISLLFVLSYPFLRYATQVFSDIPTVLFTVAMVYCHFRFTKHRRPLDLWLGYLMASLAVSLRYASGFFFLAYLYFVWDTRRYVKWHLVGVALAVIPYVPQLIYNVRYMGSPLAISYTSAHPIFGLSFFFKDMGSGHEWQLPGYIRYMFLDFRGLFLPLTPIAALGLVRSFRVIGRPMATYLVLFLVSFIVLLPFYAFFSNRYAIPAIIPCFIWLPLGIQAIGEWLRRRPVGWLLAFGVALALLAYGLFEISFQTIQSSRALHELRDRVFTRLDGYLRPGDVVYTLESVASAVTRDAPAQIEVPKADKVTPDMLAAYADRNVYVAFTPDLVTSEGGSWRLAIDEVRDRLTLLYTDEPQGVSELLLYRVLHWLHRDGVIPYEKWYVYRVVR